MAVRGRVSETPARPPTSTPPQPPGSGASDVCTSIAEALDKQVAPLRRGISLTRHTVPYAHPMEPNPLDTALLLGAIARLTRLVVLDDIARPARTLFVRVAGDIHLRAGAWAAGLVGCYFCAGFWVTLPVLASWQAWGTTPVWQLAAAALTLNYVAAHLNRVLDGTDDEDE